MPPSPQPLCPQFRWLATPLPAWQWWQQLQHRGLICLDLAPLSSLFYCSGFSISPHLLAIPWLVPLSFFSWLFWLFFLLFFLGCFTTGSSAVKLWPADIPKCLPSSLSSKWESPSWQQKFLWVIPPAPVLAFSIAFFHQTSAPNHPLCFAGYPSHLWVLMMLPNEANN